MPNTIKGKVANHLVTNAKQWIDSGSLREIGLSGDRRLRELREEGWSIKTRRNPDAPTQFQHMLARVPAKKTLAQYV
jgi:hypothetical protein